tara:strand:+ start:675 stop:800 length:126 start_codon:yes stop_codon:yes gene_type:complete
MINLLTLKISQMELRFTNVPPTNFPERKYGGLGVPLFTQAP